MALEVILEDEVFEAKGVADSVAEKRGDVLAKVERDDVPLFRVNDEKVGAIVLVLDVVLDAELHTETSDVLVTSAASAVNNDKRYINPTAQRDIAITYTIYTIHISIYFSSLFILCRIFLRLNVPCFPCLFQLPTK